jgi:hypothetical protein
MDRFQRQYIMALQSIQTAIQTLQIDEGLAVSVFLISWIDIVRGKFETTRKHLRGLRLILERLEPGCGNPTHGTTKLSPLLMQIWRVAIKFDWAASIFLLVRPVFPTVPAAEDLHRRWIKTMAAAGDATEWAIAAFALDNLIHKACHFAVQVRTLRRKNTPDIESTVLSLVTILETENSHWRQRPIIQLAELYEQAAQGILPVPSQQFLDYPAKAISNSFFANLLIAWRALSIYISLIREPSIGPNYQFRFDHAVEICRTLASLADDKSNSASSKVWILFLLGVAFGGPRRSPGESRWVRDKILEILRLVPILGAAVAAHEKLFDTEGDFWEALEKTRPEIYSP